jgi:DNA-binding transcriptional MerR regulator
VIHFLKELGLSLAEIREMLLVKKPDGGDVDTVRFLLETFHNKLKMVESKIEALQKVRRELVSTIEMLQSCERCDQKTLLSAQYCNSCSKLIPLSRVPDTFKVLLQRRSWKRGEG